MDRRRADQFLVDGGHYPTRSQAAAALLAGEVWLDGRPAKPGEATRPDAAVQVLSRPRFVSRGGEKLAAAAERFGLTVRGHVVADLGASTGGFTDCLLQAGATRVYAVDVGYGQLAQRLRADPRVVVMERTNARQLDRAAFDPLPDAVTLDLSFISLRLVWQAVRRVLAVGARSFGVALVKPQFEAGRGQVGRHGVVRDPAVHRRVLEEAVDAATEAGMGPWQLMASPLRGPRGNVEFLMALLGDGLAPRPPLDGDRARDAIDWALAEAPWPSSEGRR
jgi:23S rRNA (cytidine1920-2'-O)/16S rRNA (cytidine1409-2'-O)-methyltransferase